MKPAKEQPKKPVVEFKEDEGMKSLRPVQHAEVGAWGKFVRNQTTDKTIEDFGEFVQENNSTINVEAVNEFQNFIRADEKPQVKAVPVAPTDTRTTEEKRLELQYILFKQADENT